MRARLCAAIALLVLGCPSKPSAPPEPAPKPSTAPTASDLKLFLNGMLVTSSVRVPREPVWHSEGNQQLWWVLLVLKDRWGIETIDQLRKAVDRPIADLERNDAWLAGWLKDYPTSFTIYKKVLRENPDDLEAAIAVLDLGFLFESPESAIAGVEKLSGKTLKQADRRAPRSPAFFEERRCALLFQVGRIKEAHKACNAAIALDDTKGARDLAKVLLAEGKFKEALVQAQLALKLPPNTNEPLDAFKREFTLGLAQQHNGLQKEALTTWTNALVKWPTNKLLLRAVSEPMRSVTEWEPDEVAIHTPRLAHDLATCGHYYAELKMEERSKECYRLSEKLQPGPALAHQLVHLGATKPEEATARALKALETLPNVHLMSAAAWLLIRQKKFDAAGVWVEKALALDPDDVKATQLKWQVCSEQKDYACVIDYRNRLGLPTHFDVAKYRDVALAWKEQAEKLGLGLTAAEPDSASSPKPPKVDEIVIVPLGGRVPPELEDMAAFLGATFPPTKFTLGQLEELPAGAYRPEWRRVVWDSLKERVRAEPGRIYVLEHDLTLDADSFAFGRVDLETGRAAVSVARMRTPMGRPVSHDLTLTGNELAAVQGRLKAEMAGAAGKLLGLSFPCDVSSCALAPNRAVTDLLIGSPVLCEKHQQELKAKTPPQ
jgi:tetratricopeptide (TPR) repeat protein/predicted Zn-dependent protease